MENKQKCPCGGDSYAACCGRLHAGEPAQTAEQLMRARYSAYVLGLHQFLHESWHPDTRPPLEQLKAGNEGKWLGLELKRHQPGQDEASVEFVARYKIGGRAHRLHEISRFVREDGRWFYVDGSFPENK